MTAHKGHTLSALAAQREPSPPTMDPLEAFLRFFFSGLALGAISIIIGGQWLAQCLNIRKTPKALFRIPVPGLFTVEARGNEVGLGMSGFIATFLAISLPAGSRAYRLVRDQIGLDLGQFNSLCVLSAFVMVVWSFLFYLAIRRPWSDADPLLEEYERRIKQVSRPDEATPAKSDGE